MIYADNNPKLTDPVAVETSPRPCESMSAHGRICEVADLGQLGFDFLLNAAIKLREFLRRSGIKLKSPRHQMPSFL